MIRNEQDYELDLNLNIQFCLFSVILTINNELWRFSIKMINAEMHNVNGERGRESASYRIWRRESGQTEGKWFMSSHLKIQNLVLYLKLRV